MHETVMSVMVNVFGGDSEDKDGGGVILFSKEHFANKYDEIPEPKLI